MECLTTTRTVEPEWVGQKSYIEWSDGNRRKAGLRAAKQEITTIRAQWEQLNNERLHALADLGLNAAR